MTPYERIGGETAARAVIDDFFLRAQADDRLADVYGPAISAGGRAFVSVALDAGRADGHDDVEPALAWLLELGLGDDVVIDAARLEGGGQVADDQVQFVIAQVADQAEALRDAALISDPEDEDDEDEEEAAA